MTRIVLLTSLAALVLSSTMANAVSVTNRDERDHKITVIEGEAKVDHVLKPAQVLEGICAKGCIIRLNDSDDEEYELEATDVVSIEDGYLYYEDPEPQPGAPAPGGKDVPKK